MYQSFNPQQNPMFSSLPATAGPFGGNPYGAYGIGATSGPFGQFGAYGQASGFNPYGAYPVAGATPLSPFQQYY
eukprot:jgi/Hompol1/6027/HPOL_002353-RA